MRSLCHGHDWRLSPTEAVGMIDLRSVLELLRELLHAALVALNPGETDG
jgi:hypothetical protein